jgi:hypothetical protein
MTELRAAQTTSAELGDVLASIRRLIAQEDHVPDFDRPNRRTDATGAARSTLPLGPRAELLRSVIERELTGIEFSDDRLILGDEARANTDMTDADHAVIGTDASPEAVAQATGALPGFNEAAYQLALRDGLGGTPGQSASITLITPQPVADRQTETATLETDMMLAEVNRASLKEEAELLHDRADFDLFAPDANDEDDQLAGGNALRNLVRDVIRQELQGEMGDRISRNLRRVVRQEVAAAITAGLKTA